MTEDMKSGMLGFVTFDIPQPSKALTLALNVQKVKEIVEAKPLTPIPNESKAILGIYDFRGTPVPVLDLLSLVSKSDDSEKSREDYCRYIVCELQKVLIALPVSKTGRILSCKVSDFLPPPETSHLITGLIRIEEGYIPVLNIDSILESVKEGDTPTSDSKVVPQSRYAGKRILIVDDSRIILKKLNQLFEKLGFQCITAVNGVDAIEKLEGGSAQFDIIFTDIEMPMMDGINLARKIKANPKWCQIPVIFNTALSNPALIRDVENEKLGKYLVKFDEREVIQAIELLLI